VNDDQSINLIYALGGLVLVGSALIARRLPLKDTLKMALAWVAIFGGLFVLFALRDDFGSIWQKVKLAALGETSQAVGGSLRVAAGEGGHYFVTATVNGRPVRFMVDSGATTTAMSTEAARAAGVEVDTGSYPVVIETANGMAQAWRARIGTLRVGGIERKDMAITVSDTLGDTNLLGMNFLGSLKSWRVEGTTLVLEP